MKVNKDKLNQIIKSPKKSQLTQNNNNQQNSLLTNNAIKYFPINTSDSEEGGPRFYLATQEETTPQKLEQKIIYTKPKPKYKNLIIPQKSIILQINKTNLNNKKNNNEKLENDYRFKKYRFKNFYIPKNKKIKISPKKNENNDNFLDFCKLKVNKKILEKINKEQNEKSSKCNSPILEIDDVKNLNFNNIENNIKTDNTIKFNDSGSSNSFDVLSQNKYFLEKDFIEGIKSTKRKESLEKAMCKLERFKKYGFIPNFNQLYNSVSFNKNKQKKILSPPRKNEQKKTVISPGYYIKKTVREEHFYVDENGKRKLLNVSETTNAEPDIKNIQQTNNYKNKKIPKKAIKMNDNMNKNDDNYYFYNIKNINQYSINSYLKKNNNNEPQIENNNSNIKPKNKWYINRQNKNKIFLNNENLDDNTNNDINNINNINNISYNNTNNNISKNKYINNTINIKTNEMSINDNNNNSRVNTVNYNKAKKIIITGKNNRKINFSKTPKINNSLNNDIIKNNEISFNNFKDNHINYNFIKNEYPNKNVRIINNIQNYCKNLRHMSYKSDGSIKIKRKFTNQKLKGFIENKLEKPNNYGYREIRGFSKNSKKKTYDTGILNSNKLVSRNSNKNEANSVNKRFVYRYGGEWIDNISENNYSVVERDNFKFYESKSLRKSNMNPIHSSLSSRMEYVFPNLKKDEESLGLKYFKINGNNSQIEENRNLNKNLRGTKNFKNRNYLFSVIK